MRVSIFGVAILACVATAATPVQEASASINDFSVDLYKAICSGDSNLFVSPYSVAVALAMTRAGAAGETADEMGLFLHQSGESFTGYRELLEALAPSTVREGRGDDIRESPAYELQVANRLFGQRGLEFTPSFLERLAREFDAPMELIDFADSEAARARINGWVEKQTRDRIKDILSRGMLPADTVLALANAIYFKASWAEPFKDHLTKDGQFFAGEKVAVPFMTQAHEHGYAEVEGAQILELAHSGDDTSVVFILPKTQDGLTALEAGLDAATLAKWMGALESAPVQVKLPRFQFDCATNLTDVLPAMGMKLPFDAGKADFSGMTTASRLFIGAALHKAFIAVDEKGTEAAAATVVLMMKGAAPGRVEWKEFTADHPFMFLVRHRKTGTILFMGRVMDPS